MNCGCYNIVKYAPTQAPIRTHTIWDNSPHTLYNVQSKRIYEVHSLYIKHPIITAKIHFHLHVSKVCMHYFKLVSLLSQCILPITHFLTTRCTEANIHYHLVEETLQHCHMWQHRHKCSDFFKALLHSATAASPKIVKYSEP